jgi:hypothetical protein
MSTPAGVALPVTVVDADADRRWEQWVAKGVTSDRKTQQRTMWFTVAAGCALVAWLMAALLLR